MSWSGFLPWKYIDERKMLRQPFLSFPTLSLLEKDRVIPIYLPASFVLASFVLAVLVTAGREDGIVYNNKERNMSHEQIIKEDEYTNTNVGRYAVDNKQQRIKLLLHFLP